MIGIVIDTNIINSGSNNFMIAQFSSKLDDIILCSRTILCILVCLATFLDSASYMSVVIPPTPSAL